MTETRSASQILFGYLPNQTVDLRGGVWKVREWRTPIHETAVDLTTLRTELRRLAGPWRATGRDGNFVSDLERGRDITVLRLDRDNGVALEPFPQSWICNGCKRVLSSPGQQCLCGFQGSPRQLHFVGYCSECGELRGPVVPRCPTHNQVAIRFPGTASASEIVFSCPQCSAELRRGFGFIPCQCGGGNLTYTVHRAASVYTPRSIVIVNPPSPERLQTLMAAGGAPRAMSWLLGGMREKDLSEIPLTREVLRQQLVAQHVAPALIEAMLDAADAAGGLAEHGPEIEIPEDRLEIAQAQAVTIALACSESRLRVPDLIAGAEVTSPLRALYREHYPAAIAAAGLHAVELCDQFPVLTGMYGYTRGSSTPGASRLMAFRERSGSYRVYADLSETEALFVRLSPIRVAEWLRAQGIPIGECSDEASARAAIISACLMPGPDGEGGDAGGEALLTLVHSYAHRFVRIAAVHAGIDRNALSELLVPAHLGFFIYAAARGDFVLGGLQAVFEGELERLLGDFVGGEHRCALDPGCRSAGAACMACIHLGEPSCRLYNRFLDRRVLTGPTGYLAMAL